jgi:hypothetical protein
MKKDIEEELGKYVDSTENVNEQQNELVAQPINGLYGLREKTEKAVRIEKEIDALGYHKLPLNTLPTGGLFYDKDMVISIRAAKAEEIKHWSTMNDEDIESIKDGWNYIIERCVQVITPNSGGNWRDIIEIDRLYILLAVREITFVDNDNNLMIPISEGKTYPVSKEMIHYIEIPENIMKTYSDEERCFILKIKGGNIIRLYLPTLGVTEWLWNYVKEKEQTKQGFDKDFMTFAPMLIGSYRNLTKKMYENMVIESVKYNVKDWMAVSYVMDSLKKTLTPTFKFTGEDGTEVEVPVNFLGGAKAIFSISDTVPELC